MYSEHKQSLLFLLYNTKQLFALSTNKNVFLSIWHLSFSQYPRLQTDPLLPFSIIYLK